MELNETQARDLRLFIKEAAWALAHLRKFYDSAKPAKQPDLTEDPRQLRLFQAIEEEWREE